MWIIINITIGHERQWDAKSFNTFYFSLPFLLFIVSRTCNDECKRREEVEEKKTNTYHHNFYHFKTWSENMNDIFTFFPVCVCNMHSFILIVINKFNIIHFKYRTWTVEYRKYFGLFSSFFSFFCVGFFMKIEYNWNMIFRYDSATVTAAA